MGITSRLQYVIGLSSASITKVSFILWTFSPPFTVGTIANFNCVIKSLPSRLVGHWGDSMTCACTAVFVCGCVIMIGCDRLASERCPFAERIFTVSPDLGSPCALSRITVPLAPVSPRNQYVCPRTVNRISGLLMLWWKISSKFTSSSYASHVLGLLLGVHAADVFVLH